MKLGEVTEEHFDKTFGVNTRGALFTVQKTLPLLSDGASIILNGSIAPMKGFPALSVFSGSTAALRAFARSWVAKVKDRHIRVNVLSPGTIDTPLLDPYGTERKQYLASRVPRGHDGTPEEIASTALSWPRLMQAS